MPARFRLASTYGLDHSHRREFPRSHFIDPILMSYVDSFSLAALCHRCDLSCQYHLETAVGVIWKQFVSHNVNSLGGGGYESPTDCFTTPVTPRQSHYRNLISGSHGKATVRAATTSCLFVFVCLFWSTVELRSLDEGTATSGAL